MAVTAYGYDREAGGMQGNGFAGGALPYFSAYAARGVDIETWLSWSTSKQTLWLQDYNRTEAQQNYSEDSPQAYAYDYVNFIDDATDPTTYTDPIVNFGRSTLTPSNTFIIGALAVLYLTR